MFTAILKTAHFISVSERVCLFVYSKWRRLARRQNFCFHMHVLHCLDKIIISVYFSWVTVFLLEIHWEKQMLQQFSFFSWLKVNKALRVRILMHTNIVLCDHLDDMFCHQSAFCTNLFYMGHSTQQDRSLWCVLSQRFNAKQGRRWVLSAYSNDLIDEMDKLKYLEHRNVFLGGRRTYVNVFTCRWQFHRSDVHSKFRSHTVF